MNEEAGCRASRLSEIVMGKSVKTEYRPSVDHFTEFALAGRDLLVIPMDVYSLIQQERVLTRACVGLLLFLLFICKEIK